MPLGREEVVLDNANSKASSGKKSHGFHLVRSKFDPYPWIDSVDSQSSAEISGLRSGDCLLEIDGQDVLGLEMKEMARLIGKKDRVRLSVWRRPPKNSSHGDRSTCPGAKDTWDDDSSAQGALLEGPLPEIARKLVRAVSGVVHALECPICFESAAPPVAQCVHGHILCFGCRLKTNRCPICRVRLGQGRCLLADTSHRVLTEALVDQPLPIADHHDEEAVSPTAGTVRSLRNVIFGPSSKSATRGDQFHHRLSKVLVPSRSSSSRLDEGRNASTESLPASTSCAMDGNLLYGRRWLLRLYDRRKSASTGELSKTSREDGRPGRFAGGDDDASLLSVPQTPVWGGSTESITMSARVRCPLRERANCTESLDWASLLDHLSERHDGPLVHFYKTSVSLPVPFPFHEQEVVPLYIFHQNGEIFVMQNEKNKIWMCTVLDEINWEWMLCGVSESGAEFRSRKNVVSLREPFEFSVARHVVTLPEHLSITSVNVSLIELNSACVKV